MHDVTRVELKNHSEIKHGNTRKEIKDHMTEETDDTRNLIKSLTIAEGGKTRNDFSVLMQNAEAVKLARDEQDHLLNSLNFPGRARRMNDIKEAHCRTFQWLFGDISRPGTSKTPFLHSDETGEGDNTGESDETYRKLVEECRRKTWHSFTLWLGSGESMYWIKAKAGAGKSTLMKFLCEDPRTEQLLSNDGARSVMIISHSFFLMAAKDTPMQCNIKGFLCNVIYQLVTADNEGECLRDLTQHSKDHGRGKPSCGEWGIKQYRDACWRILAIATKSHRVCMFLDGLDEVYPSDDKHVLLDLLELFKKDFSLKMCVSSRPEVEFERGLSSYPTLELHNLTAGDMYLYALNILPNASEDTNPQPQQDFRLQKCRLASLIVERADGVFLWADIATQSLKRGTTNGDSWDQMVQRLVIMPKELNLLFASMWNRLGNDEQLYRDEVALYFNLVLDWRYFSNFIGYGCWDAEHRHYYDDDHDEFCNWKSTDHGKNISLFQLALAKREACKKNFGAWDTTLEIGSIWEDCLKLFTRLPVLSAGLLEFTGPLWHKSRAGAEIADPDVTARFIHRTAKDFFTESVEGQDILNFDKSSFGLRFSACLRAILSRGLVSGHNTLGPFFAGNVMIFTHEIAGCLYDVKALVGKEKHSQDTVACQIYHDRNINVFPNSSFGKLDFLIFAISCCLEDYVVDVFDKPSAFTSEHKSYLLSSGIVLMSTTGEVATFLGQLRIVNYLLAQGCRSEFIIVHQLHPYKTTGLQAFWDNIRNTDSWPVSNADVCDSVIITLDHFARSGANFLQSHYFYNGLDFSKIRPGPRYGLLKENIATFEEWTILGEMTHIANALVLHGRAGETAYFRRQLSKFVKNLMLDEASPSARIIAVIPRRYDWKGVEHRVVEFDWMKQAKRFPSDKEHLLLRLLADEELSPNLQWSTTSGLADRQDDHPRQLVELLESILRDDTIPRDVTNYLLDELAFVDSWPKALNEELFEMGISCSKDQILKDSENYPPAKYVDHSHELAWKLTSRIPHI